jgi:hypothetical protein
VFGVTVTSMSFLTGCAELARKDNEETRGARAKARADAAAANDEKLREFMQAQIQAMGLQEDEQLLEAAA